jgi:N-acyl-D-amino-acid deacylase
MRFFSLFFWLAIALSAEDYDLLMRNARVVDGKERVVAPGFIDVHTHVEGGVEKVPGGDNYLMDGVTTIVTGNCGGSKADLGAWFSSIEKGGLGLNLASLTGHNTVRSEVMGIANRLATPEEEGKLTGARPGKIVRHISQ